MATAKAISVVLNSSASEVAKNKVEEVVGNSGGVSEVIRDANGKVMPMALTTLYVKTGGTASREFRKVLAGDNKLQAATIGNVNIYNNGQYTLIETPFITSDTAWFAHASNMPNSFVMNFIKRPTVDEKVRRENLDDVFPLSGSFTFGNVYLPQDWYGSTGLS